MIEQCLDFGRKSEQTAVPVIVERLNAQPVARAEEPLPLAIPNDVREHAAKKLDAVRAVLLICVQNGFGVGQRDIPMARGPPPKPFCTHMSSTARTAKSFFAACSRTSFGI